MQNFEREVLELSNELDKLISYDEWAAREYGSTSVDCYDTAYNLIKAGYRKRTRMFFDIETMEVITEDVLKETLEELKECDPDTYGDITIGQYINNCLTTNNGTLIELTTQN